VSPSKILAEILLEFRLDGGKLRLCFRVEALIVKLQTRGIEGGQKFVSSGGPRLP